MKRELQSAQESVDDFFRTNKIFADRVQYDPAKHNKLIGLNYTKDTLSNALRCFVEEKRENVSSRIYVAPSVFDTEPYYIFNFAQYYKEAENTFMGIGLLDDKTIKRLAYATLQAGITKENLPYIEATYPDREKVKLVEMKAGETRFSEQQLFDLAYYVETFNMMAEDNRLWKNWRMYKQGASAENQYVVAMSAVSKIIGIDEEGKKIGGASRSAVLRCLERVFKEVAGELASPKCRTKVVCTGERLSLSIGPRNGYANPFLKLFTYRKEDCRGESDPACVRFAAQYCDYDQNDLCAFIKNERMFMSLPDKEALFNQINAFHLMSLLGRLVDNWEQYKLGGNGPVIKLSKPIPGLMPLSPRS